MTTAQMADTTPYIMTRRRFNVDDFYRMAEAGILQYGSRVELIEGEIIEMAAMGDPHAGGTNRLNRVFTGRLGEQVVVSVQNPVRLSPLSEPQPDLMLLLPRADFYATSKPAPADVLLLIEISDTTLRYDRDVKVPLYAAAGIAEVWIVDLQSDRLRVFHGPDAGEYRHIELFARGATVSPQSFPELQLSVDEILG